MTRKNDDGLYSELAKNKKSVETKVEESVTSQEVKDETNE